MSPLRYWAALGAHAFFDAVTSIQGWRAIIFSALVVLSSIGITGYRHGATAMKFDVQTAVSALFNALPSTALAFTAVYLLTLLKAPSDQHNEDAAQIRRLQAEVTSAQAARDSMKTDLELNRPHVLIDDLPADDIRAMALSNTGNRQRPDLAFSRGYPFVSSEHTEGLLYTASNRGRLTAKNVRYYHRVLSYGPTGDAEVVATPPEGTGVQALLPGQTVTRQLTYPIGTVYNAEARGQVRVVLVVTYSAPVSTHDLYYYKVVLSVDKSPSLRDQTGGVKIEVTDEGSIAAGATDTLLLP